MCLKLFNRIGTAWHCQISISTCTTTFTTATLGFFFQPACKVSETWQCCRCCSLKVFFSPLPCFQAACCFSTWWSCFCLLLLVALDYRWAKWIWLNSQGCQELIVLLTVQGIFQVMNLVSKCSALLSSVSVDVLLLLQDPAQTPQPVPVFVTPKASRVFNVLQKCLGIFIRDSCILVGKSRLLWSIAGAPSWWWGAVVFVIVSVCAAALTCWCLFNALVRSITSCPSWWWIRFWLKSRASTSICMERGRSKLAAVVAFNAANTAASRYHQQKNDSKVAELKWKGELSWQAGRLVGRTSSCKWQNHNNVSAVIGLHIWREIRWSRQNFFWLLVVSNMNGSDKINEWSNTFCNQWQPW